MKRGKFEQETVTTRTVHDKKSSLKTEEPEFEPEILHFLTNESTGGMNEPTQLAFLPK